jgi:TetR/AcrR family transcriptional repressor of nem operon
MPRTSLREQIIDAAMETLHKKGFNNSSVQDIADAAHAPKGSFYNHFESKEQIAVAALDRYWERVQAALSVLDDKTIPPRERISRYFRRLDSVAAKDGFRRGCMIGNMSAEVADQSALARKRLAGLLSSWTDAIESCVKEAQADGSIRQDLGAREIAAFLLNAWEGALLRAKVDRSPDALSIFERVVSIMLAKA